VSVNACFRQPSFGYGILDTMDQDLLQKIKSVGLLEVIRERPPLYLGERSLSALAAYLHGFRMALFVHDLHTESVLPPDFHDWVAYRLRFFESTSGYKNMILKHVPDEAAALDRFFELLDQHRVRKPSVVARYKVEGGRGKVVHTGTYPATLNLIAYTDDPGFFVSSDDPNADFLFKDHFFATIESFELRFGVSKDGITILDPSTFTSWLSKEKRFSRSS
jgi:hypothetical protein